MPETLRLTDWAATPGNGNDVSKALVVDLFNSGSIMARDIPFFTKGAMTLTGGRIADLPDITWVNINESPTGEHTKPQQFQEQVFLSRSLIRTDRALLADESRIGNPHLTSARAYLMSFAAEFNDKFFNGHHRPGGDTKALVGIRERLDDPEKYGTLSENKIDGDGVDMSPAGTVDEFSQFVELLSEVLWRVGSPNGNGVVLYVSSQFKWRLDAKLARFAGSGGFSQATDQFERTVTMFRGARIEDVGLQKDQATPIITVTENADGEDDDGTFTSLYAVNYSEGHCAGWTHLPLKAIEVPDGDDGIYRKTLIEWAGGLWPQSRRCFARLHNIKFA